MIVTWAPLAVERAREIAKYIAADKPEAALRWLDGLYDAAKRLTLFPRSGRVVPEVGRQEYREIIYRRSHRVIYRIEASRVLILTVRNCAQRLDLAEVVPIDRKR